MDNVKKLLRSAAEASDLVSYSLEVHAQMNKALTKGLTETQVTIILAGYIRSLAEASIDPSLVSELAIAEIKKIKKD